MQLRFQAFEQQDAEPVMVATLYGPSGVGKSAWFRQMTGIDVPSGDVVRPMTFACAMAVPQSLNDAGRLGRRNAVYLPAAFYGMAISLLRVSLLPGHILLAMRMRRVCAKLDPRALVDGIEFPVATASLRAAPERLGDFLRDTLTLRSTLQLLRRELDLELPSASIVRLVRSDAGRDAASGVFGNAGPGLTGG